MRHGNVKSDEPELKVGQVMMRWAYANAVALERDATSIFVKMFERCRATVVSLKRSLVDRRVHFDSPCGCRAVPALTPARLGRAARSSSHDWSFAPMACHGHVFDTLLTRRSGAGTPPEGNKIMKRQQLIAVLALAGGLAACQAHPMNGKLNASPSRTATILSTTAATAPAPRIAPPVPPPPSDEAILGAIPECANGGCGVFDRHDGFASPDGPATLAIVHVPHPGYGEAVNGGVYLVSNGGALVWSTHPTCLFGPGGEQPRIVIDGSGNALVPVSTGAHNGFVGVVRVARSGVEDFGSFNMAEPFFGNGGSGRVRPDPTQPGLDQLLIGHIDCTPSCADGPNTFTVLSWNGSRYVVTGVEAA